MKEVNETLRSVKERIAYYLVKFPEYRDNDEMLVAKFWYDELKRMGKDLRIMTTQDFLITYGKGELTPSDIIIRARRRAQEELPELRGKKWDERHREAKKVRNQIGDSY
jgi:hypothetical protein